MAGCGCCVIVGGMTARARYLSAVDAFVDIIDRLPDDGWGREGLGVWDLRALVGHASTAALSSVITAVDRPAGSEMIGSPERYYAFGRTLDPEVYRAAVAAATAGAREQGAALGEHPAVVVRGLAEEVAARLARVPGDPLIESAAGGMRLNTWLPTRTFELVVHSLDIASSASLPVSIPEVVLADAAALAARVGAETGQAVTVLRALTGRAALPSDFSVL